MHKVDCGPHFVPTSVDADFLWVVLEDEAVVDEGLFSAEVEALAGLDAGEFGDFAGGKGSIVDDLVEVGEELALGAGDSGLAGQVPEAGGKRTLAGTREGDANADIPVVCDVDDSLLDFVTNELNLVLPVQVHTLNALLRLADSVVNLGLDRSRESCIAVLADVLEHDLLPAVPVHRRRSLPGGLSPSVAATVEVVLASLVGLEFVGLAIEAVDLSSGDAVRNAADGFAEEGFVAGLSVDLLAGVAEGDVDAADGEGLDNGAEGEELDGACLRRHGVVMWFYAGLIECVTSKETGEDFIGRRRTNWSRK